MSVSRRAIRALLAWQRAAGPYWPYVCAAPFLAEKAVLHPALPRATPASRAVVEAICRASEGKPLVVVDLPAILTLSATPCLHRHGYRVVPIIQRWIVPNALLPSQRLLNALSEVPRRLDPGAEPVRGIVLCLDGERGGEAAPSRSVSPTRFDNRYAYPVCRFPPQRFLQSDGITEVIWISNGPVADDLLLYRESLTPDLPSRELILSTPEVESLNVAG